jgi:predicted amidophosphoribosyltransferase
MAQCPGRIHVAWLGVGQIEGKRVVLIDDVLTTGATVSSCTGVLLRPALPTSMF